MLRLVGSFLGAGALLGAIIAGVTWPRSATVAEAHKRHHLARIAGPTKEINVPTTEAEKAAVKQGQGVIKNGRYFNTGKTYDADGRLRFDFDARNAHDPAFNGLEFSHYEDDQPVFKTPR